MTLDRSTASLYFDPSKQCRIKEVKPCVKPLTQKGGNEYDTVDKECDDSTC
jgi:hypothetical protein